MSWLDGVLWVMFIGFSAGFRKDGPLRHWLIVVSKTRPRWRDSSIKPAERLPTLQLVAIGVAFQPNAVENPLFVVGWDSDDILIMQQPKVEPRR